ncbi:MAG: DNA polymerase I [bacterium JZ-2024 1]
MIKKAGKNLLLLDGMNLLYRAFYVLPPMKTTKGFPTGGLYGFFQMCVKAQKEFQPDALWVALDKGKPLRFQWYAGYKATREKPPEDLKIQTQHFEEFLAKMRLPYLAYPGWEADDIITTLTEAYRQEYDRIYILSADRDLLQLLSPTTFVVVPEKGITHTKIYTPEKFEEEYGFPHFLLPDFKALSGDVSDNIPGIPGIGEKTAARLLQKYGRLENLYEQLDSVEEKWKNLLIQYKEQVFLWKKLVTLESLKDLPVPEPSSWSFQNAEILDALREYEFTSILKEWAVPLVSEQSRQTFPKILSPHQIQKAIAQSPVTALYLLPSEQSIIPPRICVGVSEGSACLSLGEETTIDLLSQVWADPTREKITFGIKHLYRFFRNLSVYPKGEIFDVQLASFLSDSEEECGWKDLLRKYHSLLSVPEEEYFGGLLYSLAPVLKKITEELGLTQILKEIWIPFTYCLADMEDAGIRVETSLLRELGRNLDHQLHQLEETAYYLAGRQFNLNSPRQIAEVLFEQLKLPRIKGKSTDIEVLESLRDRHPLIPVLIEYRSLSKFQNTYVDGLLSQAGQSGKIHTTFLETGTKTGRLSSKEPNLQNIPIRSELGIALRNTFSPPTPGWVFLSSDYSQMDLRILAHLSKDDALMRSFLNGEDIHSTTASEIFGVKKEEVTPELRRKAKGINFGIVYGISDFGLASQIGCSREEAKKYLERYFSAHPGVREYMRKLLENTREKGYVTTILGRRRSIPGIRSENSAVRKAAERAALNTPVQGSSADFITIAMVRIHQSLSPKEARLLLQVHDELLLEVAPDALPQVAQKVKNLMEQAIPLSVPVVVEQKVGRTWGNLTIPAFLSEKGGGMYA